MQGRHAVALGAASACRQHRGRPPCDTWQSRLSLQASSASEAARTTDWTAAECSWQMRLTQKVPKLWATKQAGRAACCRAAATAAAAMASTSAARWPSLRDTAGSSSRMTVLAGQAWLSACSKCKYGSCTGQEVYIIPAWLSGCSQHSMPRQGLLSAPGISQYTAWHQSACHGTGFASSSGSALTGWWQDLGNCMPWVMMLYHAAARRFDAGHLACRPASYATDIRQTKQMSDIPLQARRRG